MLRLFSLLRKKRTKWLAVFSLLAMVATLSASGGWIQTIQAAVTGDEMTQNPANISSILRYDYEKGRSDQDNQGIQKEYSLQFSKTTEKPTISGKVSAYTKATDSGSTTRDVFYLKNNKKGEVSALFKNIATYTRYENGRAKEVIPLDCKMTIVDWLGYEGQEVDPFITFTGAAGGDMSVGIRNVNWIKFKKEFYRAGTSQLVTVKGLVTEYDIDDRQFVGINQDDIEKLYINKKSTNLTYGTPDFGGKYLTFYNKIDGNAPAEDLYKNMFSYTFTGNKITEVFGSTECPSGIDWLFCTGTKYVYTLKPDAPRKMVSDDDESQVTSNHVASRLDAWTYEIEQDVPLENMTQNYWNGFYFEDQIESCLDILDVKVVDEDNKDVTSKFTLEKNNHKIKATAKEVKTSSFYGHFYRLQIKVRVRKDAESQLESHGHYNPSKTQLKFYNKGKTVISEGSHVYEEDTNQVETTVELPEVKVNEPGLQITKSAKHYEWQVKDMVTYRVKVSHNNEKATATDVVVSDESLPKDLKIDWDTFKVSGIADYKLEKEDNGWKVTTQQLKSTETIEITFDALAGKELNGKEVLNTAKAIAWAVPEKQDEAAVYINSPKMKIQKTTNKKEYKVGDTIVYHLEVSQENEGCIMKNVIIEDEIQTEGVDLKEGSVSIKNQDGKDITKDCDITTKGNHLLIETKKDLVLGDNPYGETKEMKFYVTYDAEIVDENLSGFDVENIAKAPPTENINGELIREDEEIPSGGDEVKHQVTVKGAQLEIEKESDQNQYQVGDIGEYQLKVRQLREGTTARQVVIEDELQQQGVRLKKDSIRVYLQQLDITDECKIDVNDRGFHIDTNRDLPFGFYLKVEYKVEFLEGAQKESPITNVAVTKADNAKETKVTHKVKVEKPGVIAKTKNTTKGTNQQVPKTQDTNMNTFVIIGLICSSLGLFLYLFLKLGIIKKKE